MKKYLYSALALPLLFACSADDLLDKKVVSNDQFAGIEKVDATFFMDESAGTRMATDWGAQMGDTLGFAWLGDDDVITDAHANWGQAFQNHPLILKTVDGVNKFIPETSIYVGKYYVYYPYDYTTVDVGKINFKSLEMQTITDGMGGANWSAVAKKSINIGDKWTEVTKAGTTIDGTVWEKAGIKQSYHLYAAPFSNQTGLELTYVKNNVSFTESKIISGATDIEFDAKGSDIGAADIYGGTVQLEGAAKSFTYAPKTEPNGTHNRLFWADKSGASTFKVDDTNGFTFEAGAITLKAPKDAENGISTDKADNKGWFWFNSLPVTAGTATVDTKVTTILNTSYGDVTVKTGENYDQDVTLGDCAQAFDPATKKWIPLAAADNDNPKKWGIAGHSTFVNQYGDHKGKYVLTVDFSKGVMNKMHIKNDAHLQKALKYYIASNKTENPVVLNLDKDVNGVFKISKLSIALLQTIGGNVTVQACTVAEEKPNKIIVTQDGQTKENGLDSKKEVPALNNVFAVATDVYLAKNTEWTWTEGAAAEGKIPGGKLTIDANVSKITNEGTLTVKATNVELSEADVKIINAKDATMNITKVTTVKNTLHNYGTLNVGSKDNTTAELRAYGPKWIVNNATSLTEHGVINNFGVVGVTAGTSGQFHNYGLIKMMNDDAITLLTSNEKGATPFKNTFDSSTNKMGTVELPERNPYAIVSVSNAAENGFIKYNWTAATYAHDPGNVKYNTIVVSDNIEFTGDVAATEIQFIEFDGTNRALVVNPAGAASKLTELKGIIVKDNSSIVIEKTNEINCKVGAFLGEGATVYKGGAFTVDGADFAVANTTNYLGTWSLDQIVEY